MVQFLPLINHEGMVAVDDSTYPILCGHRWWLSRSGHGRPYTSIPKEDRKQGGPWCAYLARLLTRAVPGVHMVQHINGNTLDCRMSNLRLVSASSPDRGQAGHPMKPKNQLLGRNAELVWL